MTDQKTSALCSTVTKKYLMAISGLLLVLFLISHLSANLLLLKTNSDAFNRYVNYLNSFGWLLIAAEIGLLAVFVLHIVTAVQVSLTNKKARPIEYKLIQTKGGPSKSNIASRNMRITGLIIFIFLVFHIIQLRFGPGVNEGYTIDINGSTARDLHRLAIEKFQNPLNVIIYCFTMIVLGLHLRHGFWSAFQSLGLTHLKISNMLYKSAVVIAIIFSVGFFIIPIWIYFDFIGVYR